MANITNVRLSDVLTEQVLQDILANIRKVDDDMPFLLGLTVEEKQNLPKINNSNRLFVERVLEVIPNNTELLPSYIDVENLAKNFRLFQQLEIIQAELHQLTRRVSDTRTLAGSGSYTTSLVVYRMVQVAAASGVPGASALLDHLKERFNNQNPSSEEEDEMTEEDG